MDNFTGDYDHLKNAYRGLPVDLHPETNKCVILYYTKFYRWVWSGGYDKSGNVSENSIIWS